MSSLAYLLNRPNRPADNSCPHGIAPLPLSVCATGMPAPSARRSRASWAPDRCTPPPARMSGRRAPASDSAARSTSDASGRVRRAGTRAVARSAWRSPAAKACSACATSSGTSITTGPGRPDVATVYARRTTSGTRSTASTRISSLTAGRRISTCLASCVMLRQECPRWVSPVRAITGTPAFSDSTRAVTRFVAPGPSVPSQIPGRPVSRA